MTVGDTCDSIENFTGLVIFAGSMWARTKHSEILLAICRQPKIMKWLYIYTRVH